MRALSPTLCQLAFFVLNRVHGGVGGAQQAVCGGAVLGVKGYAEAGCAFQGVPLEDEWIVEAVIQALRDLLDVGAIAHHGEQRDKLIASQPRQQIVGAELQFHAPCHLLQIEVSDVMAVEIVHLLEFIKVDVDQPEDVGIPARLINLGVQALLK